MEKKKISVLTFVLVIIIVLAIGVVAGYFVSIKLNEGKPSENNTIKNELSVNDSEEKEENKIENKIEEVEEVEVEEDEEEELASGERKLTQNELDLFENYLNAPAIVNFLYFPYKDLTEFSLGTYLKYRVGRYEATLEEAKMITGEEEPLVPVHLYNKSVIDEFFKEHTGEDISIVKNIGGYSEELQCYYTRTSDAEYIYVNVISGIEDGDKYIIKYNDTENNFTSEYEVTLRKVNGKYLFVSNVQL